MKISDLLRDFADTHLLRGIADAIDQQEAERGNDNVPAAQAEQPDDVKRSYTFWS